MKRGLRIEDRGLCRHEEAFNLPCGKQQCPECGTPVTIGCDGDEGNCRVCVKVTRFSPRHRMRKEGKILAIIERNVPAILDPQSSILASAASP